MAVEAKAGTMAHSLTQAMDHAHGRLCLELERSVMSPSASTLSLIMGSWRYGASAAAGER